MKIARCLVVLVLAGCPGAPPDRASAPTSSTGATSDRPLRSVRAWRSRTSAALVALFPFLFCWCARSHVPAPRFAWPAPPGWKSETIPFPLDFAPDIPHRGVEEVRFEPRFFDPAADTYFTYSFAWVMDDARPPSAEELSSDLRRYFSGLMRAVGSEKHASYPESAFDARVDAVGTAHYRGVVHAVDAFGDGRALVLNLDAESLACGDKTVLLVSLSPHAPDDATFHSLLAQRGTFRCAP